jgi:hypothetical protein
MSSSAEQSMQSVKFLKQADELNIPIQSKLWSLQMKRRGWTAPKSDKYTVAYKTWGFYSIGTNQAFH